MDKFVFGLFFGAVLGAGGYYGYESQQPVANCDDRCGAGTTCLDGSCQVVVAQAEEEPEDPKSKKKKRRRKKKKKSGGGGDAVATSDASMNDSHIPRYDRTKAKMIGEDTGSERLSDRKINGVLKGLDPKFQSCIAKAAAASEAELASGRVKYEFGIAPTGKVTGVNVTAPSHLKALGVDSCVRVAVFGAKFPGFNGIEMGATGSFSI